MRENVGEDEFDENGVDQQHDAQHDQLDGVRQLEEGGTGHHGQHPQVHEILHQQRIQIK